MAEPASTTESGTLEARKKGKAGRSSYLSEPARIVQAIKVFRDQRAHIQLRFDQDATCYTARVLDVRNGEFYLDDVHPREGLKMLRAGKPFSVAGRVDGMYVYCAHNVVSRSESERGVPYFHVKLPASLLFQQRRQNTRFRLPLSVAAKGANVSLFRSSLPGTALVGRLLDISAGGCRAEFTGPLSPPFAVDEMVHSCVIQISNELELRSKAAVRHLAHDENHCKITCGIELTDMDVTDRRRLELFIQSIARSS